MDVVIDCDPGIDDAVALAYLAGEQLAGRVRLSGVTTVNGNVDVTRTGRNAAFVLDRLGLVEVPVGRGAAAPLTPLAVPVDTSAAHGDDGLGGLHDPSHPDRSEGTSIGTTQDLLAGTPTGSRPELLAIAPLTNPARWFATDPSTARSLSRMVIMGGAFGDPAGNITRSAEYNFHLDGLAAARVMSSGAPITLVPLDVTTKVVIGPGDLHHLSDSAAGRLVRELLRAAMALHARFTGLDECMMHDALAAAIMVEPSLVEYTTAHVSVTTTGDDRGHTELTPASDGPVRVALQVDVDGARDQILGSLARL